MLRFIHSSDLHLGRRFGNLPEAIRGRLVEARHGALTRLAEAARRHGAEHVLLAGDIFDTETPADPVWRQALSAMAHAEGLHWWLLPGNHDSLAAEALWSRLADKAPANVHPVCSPEPVELAPGAWLIPAPVTRRYPGVDATAGMAEAATPAGALRIGLAHGGVVDFGGEEGVRATIPPDRACSAGLGYLALGDWHGRLAISARCHYSGTPEPDRFKSDGRGVCLAVTLAGAEADPEVVDIATGQFRWADLTLDLLPDQDAEAALRDLVAADDAPHWRGTLLRIRARGRATLAQQDALRRTAAEVEPDFCFFELDNGALGTEYEEADLDEIASGGALRIAAEALRDEAFNEALAAEDRRVAAAALNRLYGYLKEAEQ
jgi:DNA repair exonuclease SbcCD nuclease subunit